MLMTVDLAGLEPTASALQARRSPFDELLAQTAPRGAAMQLSDGAGVNSPKRPRWPFLLPSVAICSISHRATERALTGPSRSSRTDPVLVRNRLSAPHHGGRAQPASVPPLHAGVESREMEARVDCGDVDPPCVSGLLCRC